MPVKFLEHQATIPALLEGLAISFLLFHFSYLAFAGLIVTTLVVLVYRYIIKPATGPSPDAVQGRAQVVVSQDDYFNQLQNPKVVLITGAAQGVGLALCKQYLTKKAKSLTTLVMIDFHPEVLATTAAELKTTLPADSTINIVTEVCDVTKRQEMHDLMTRLHDLYNLDVVVANAGVSPLSFVDQSFEDQTHTVVDVNIDGVLNTVLPIHQAFRRAGSHGDVKQILLMSSVSSLLPLVAASYGGSKSFVTGWGRVLRQEMATFNVSVVVAAPAWIQTQMVDAVQKRVKLNGVLTPEDATARMLEACDIDEGLFVTPPTQWLSIAMFGTAIGYKMWDIIASRLLQASAPTYGDHDVSTPPTAAAGVAKKTASQQDDKVEKVD